MALPRQLQQYTFNVFVCPELMPAIDKNEVTLFPRIINDTEVNLQKRYSKIGAPGDKWVIAEPGRLFENNIFVRYDNTAVALENREPLEIATHYNYDDLEGEFIHCENMPRWAARYKYNLIDVSLPQRINTMQDYDYTAMGLIMEGRNDKTNMCSFRMGEKIITVSDGRESIKNAFAVIWNDSFGKWRTSVINGVKCNVAFLFDKGYEPSGVRDKKLEDVIIHAPYVTLFRAKKTD